MEQPFDFFRYRIMSKVKRLGPVVKGQPELGRCWIWKASCDGAGYGMASYPAPKGSGTPSKRVKAHRIVYELLVGPIPEGLELDHLCEVRRCVNPEHLEPVTHSENQLRGVARRAARRKAVVKTPAPLRFWWTDYRKP